MISGKGGRGGSDKKARSKSVRAGLKFPVARIGRYLRKAKIANRVSPGAMVYMAAVLEYLAAEVLELSGNAAHDHKRTRIIPRHIQLAVRYFNRLYQCKYHIFKLLLYVYRNDEELNKLFQNITIAEGGVLPNIHSVLLPKRSAAAKALVASQSE